MESIGSITAVLNDALVLVKIDKSAIVSVGDRLRVFGRLDSEDLRTATGLPYIDVPKGFIRLSVPQEDGVYLAERYQNPETHMRQFVPTLQPSVLGLLMEKSEIVPGTWSAVFDASESLNLDINTHVKKGDFVEKI